MKKFCIVFLVLMFIFSSLPQNSLATNVNNTKPSFADPDFYLYSSDDTYQVKNGKMYVKNSKNKFVLHSEKLISNKKIMNVTKSLLDKDRYTYVSYSNANNDQKVERVHVTFATNRMAAMLGYKPIAYYFNINKKAKNEYAKNIRVGLTLDYLFYDSKTKKYNSPILKKKLKNSLIELHGKNNGEKMYKYIESNRSKYYKKPLKQYQVIYDSKKIGNVVVSLSAAHDLLFVNFSY